MLPGLPRKHSAGGNTCRFPCRSQVECPVLDRVHEGCTRILRLPGLICCISRRKPGALRLQHQLPPQRNIHLPSEVSRPGVPYMLPLSEVAYIKADWPGSTWCYMAPHGAVSSGAQGLSQQCQTPAAMLRMGLCLVAASPSSKKRMQSCRAGLAVPGASQQALAGTSWLGTHAALIWPAVQAARPAAEVALESSHVHPEPKALRAGHAGPNCTQLSSQPCPASSCSAELHSTAGRLDCCWPRILHDDQSCGMLACWPPSIARMTLSFCCRAG